MSYIGVDGGGTRSRAMVLDSEGRDIGTADGGPGLISPADPEAAARAVVALVRDAARGANTALPARSLWVGLAGAGRSGPRQRVEAVLREAVLADRVEVGTDVEAAHADAFDAAPGILLVVGTGSVAYGRDPSGDAWTVGGWGRLLGDEGSGYRIGMDGLRAVVRSVDGREPPTALTALLLDRTGLDDPAGLVEWVAHASKGDIAALSPLVAQAARGGDPLAARVVHGALGEIRALLEAALARAEGWPAPVPVALVGGLVRPGGELRDPVEEMARELGCAVVDGAVVPERGAARLAMRLAGVS